ncbi:MAG: glycosyltransferase family A protein, partial [Ornithinimicrobium sp.]
IDLFRRVFEKDELCGCGQRFSECPFWQEVGARAFGGWDVSVVGEVATLQRRVARQRFIPHHLSPAKSAAFLRDSTAYRERYALLYQAIHETAGASVVVDASKWPAQAAALIGPEIDLRVIHVQRDVRGVAWSMGKRQVVRPQDTQGQDLMESTGVKAAALRWSLCQSEVGLLRLTGVPMVRIRYEDLITDPQNQVAHALEAIGLPAPSMALQHIGQRQVDLGPSHGLSGNPSRFAEGTTTLSLDQAWKGQMSRPDQVIVSAMGLPHLLSLPSRAATTPPHPRRPGVNIPLESSTSTDDRSNEAPLVSVILATRGRPELVRESIRSVVAQDYRGHLQVIVVHDQEDPDPALADLQAERRHITILTNAHSPGLTGARNTGVDEAVGGFIATCDDDDTWHPTKLRKQMDLLQTHPELLAVGCGIRLMFPENRVVEWPGHQERVGLDRLVRNRVKELHSSTLVMRSDAYAKAGGYDEELPHAYGEDYDFVLRLARVGKIGVVTEPLADIRKDVQSWFRERSQNTSEALRYLLEHHPEIRDSRRGHARVLGQIAFAESSMGERTTALRTIGSSLRRYPAAPHAHLAVFHVATGTHPMTLLKAARRTGRGLS